MCSVCICLYVHVAYVYACVHACVCTHVPASAFRSALSGPAQPGLCLSPRASQHHALQLHSVIALLIDSLTLDKSLKFSAYSSARGKVCESPLKITQHYTNARTALKLEALATCNPGSKALSGCKPTGSWLHGEPWSSAWFHCP